MVDLPRLTSEPLLILNTEPLGYSQEARIITPHSAGATTEAMERTEINMARLLPGYLQGDPER